LTLNHSLLFLPVACFCDSIRILQEIPAKFQQFLRDRQRLLILPKSFFSCLSIAGPLYPATNTGGSAHVEEEKEGYFGVYLLQEKVVKWMWNFLWESLFFYTFTVLFVHLLISSSRCCLFVCLHVVFFSFVFFLFFLFLLLFLC
jgi:hypothetical protein